MLQICTLPLLLCQIPSPQEVSNTSVVGQSVIYGPLEKNKKPKNQKPNPREMPRKSIVPGYSPFCVYILPLLTIPVSAVKPGVNVLFKQPTTAEKWRHKPGLISRASWTLPLLCSGCRGWAARGTLPGPVEPSPNWEEEKCTFGCHRRAQGSPRHRAGAPARCPLPCQPQASAPWSRPPCPPLTKLLPPSHPVN